MTQFSHRLLRCLAGYILFIAFPHLAAREQQVMTCQNLQSFGTRATIYDLAIWNNRTYICGAIGRYKDRGVIYSSSDGFQWGEPVYNLAEPESEIQHFYHNEDTLLAQGSTGMLRTTDGITWQHLPSLPTFKDILWDGEHFLALSGNTIWQADAQGDNWQQVSKLSTGSVRVLAWNGERYIIAGDSDYFFYSDDGVNWMEGTAPNLSEEIYGVVWNGHQFLARSETNTSWLSEDGITWTAFEGEPLEHGSYFAKDLTWDGEAYYEITRLYIYTSPDGVTWQRRPFFGPQAATRRLNLRRRGETWWLLGHGIFSSRNGYHWTQKAPAFSRFDLYQKYDDTVYASSNRILYRSRDGLTWDILAATRDRFTQLAVQNNAVMASTEGGELFFSEDGLHVQLLGAPISIESIFAAKGFWWIVNKKGSIHQFDGERTLRPFPLVGHQMIEAEGHLFLYSNEDNDQIVYQSQDGLAWTQVASQGAPTMRAVRNNRLFISQDVFANHYSHYSSDGYHWYPFRIGDYVGERAHPWGDYWFMIDGRISEPKPILISEDARDWKELVIEGLPQELEPGRGFYSVGDLNLFLPHQSRSDLLTQPAYFLAACTTPARPKPKPILVPWVTSNEQWSSRISFFNRSPYDREVTVSALKGMSTQQTTLFLPAKSVTVRTSDELFEDLTPYSLLVDPQDLDLTVSFLTFNKEAVSGGASPSQSSGIDRNQWSPKITFPYLPHDRTTTMVVCAPGATSDERTLIRLSFYGKNGDLQRYKIEGLTGNAPFTIPAREQFQPDSSSMPASIVVESLTGRLLAGTTFIFDEHRQPAMMNAVPGSIIHE